MKGTEGYGIDFTVQLLACSFEGTPANIGIKLAAVEVWRCLFDTISNDSNFLHS